MKIAVVDSTTSGHRETFYKQFARSWQEAGHTVMMFTPTSIEGIMHQALELKPLLPLPTNQFLKKKLTVIQNAGIRIDNLKTVRDSVKPFAPDLVYFACLDDFLPTLSSATSLNIVMPYRWSGLLVQSALANYKWYMPDVRSALKHLNCVGIGVLNEFSIEPLRAWQPNIDRLPDFADLSAPNKEYTLAQEIANKASGRKIVSLLGSINKRKGVDLLLRTIERMAHDEFFFVIAGKSSLTADETEQLLSFANKHTNMVVSLERIPTEADFNALVAQSDVIFAVYQQFTGSSNMLTKAAAFEKPVVVATKQCMGKRVEEYKIGIAIDETDANACSEAIIKLCNQPIDSKNYVQYSALHRTETLKNCLSNVTNRIS